MWSGAPMLVLVIEESGSTDTNAQSEGLNPKQKAQAGNFPNNVKSTSSQNLHE